MPNLLKYAGYEIKRNLRDKQFMGFTLLFPVVFYMLIVLPQKGEANFDNNGTSVALYYMISLISFSSVLAIVTMGSSIATERSGGWNRQLLITPLSPLMHIASKILSGYLVATMTILLLYITGFANGVRIDAITWIEMTILILVALAPFALLGVALGHLFSGKAVQGLVGGLVSLLAFVSGTWFPLGETGFLHDLAQNLPSYWVSQAARLASDGQGWPLYAWVVIIVWCALLGLLSRWAYSRDTQKA